MPAFDRRPTSEPPPRQSRRATAVIPAKNEAGNIGWVLEHLPTGIDEVVLVDGHSTDDTIAVARSVRPDIVVVVDGIPGKGAAIRTGVAAATGDDVVMLDADGSMDPREIERFLIQLRAGYDLVKGSRFLPSGGTADMTPLRDLGNRCLLLLANLLHGTAHTDLCYGFAAFRREAFARLGLTADGFEIEAQLFLRAHRRGLRVTEVPSFEAPRRFGNSNLNTFRDGWRVLRTIVRERMLPAAPEPEQVAIDAAALVPVVQVAAALVAATVMDGGVEAQPPSPIRQFEEQPRAPATRPCSPRGPRGPADVGRALRAAGPAARVARSN